MLDAVLNVAFYIPIGAAAFGWLASKQRRGVFAIVAAVAFGTLVSLIVERTQLFIPTRVGSLTDLLCNSAGNLLGVAIAFVATSPSLAPRVRIVFSPGVLLLGLWALWQAFLFLPQYGPTIDVSHEIVGVLMLAAVAVRWKIPVVVPLMLLWLVVDELRPFQFRSPPQPFWWLPFDSWFAGAPDTYYGTFFRKLFFYTAILWVERMYGMRWIWALAAPGAILFVGEFAQCYLPGRTPETTDLALLAAGAILLNLASNNRDQA
jgi:VanZ family protein